MRAPVFRKAVGHGESEVVVVAKELLQERVEAQLLKLLRHYGLREYVDLAYLTLALDVDGLVLGLLHTGQALFWVRIGLLAKAHLHLHVAVLVEVLESVV